MRRVSAALLLIGLTFAGTEALAQAPTTLTAEIVSWQVIGLDSNQPATAEPEVFLVQVKVTNSGSSTAIDPTATLTLGTLAPNPCDPVACITLVTPSLRALSDLAPGATTDVFWSLRVAKTAAAFDSLTPISIDVGATNAPSVTATQASRTPAPCGATDTPGSTLLVERLISQARNDVLSYSVSPGVQLPDGSWEVPLGSMFTVTVQADTATAYDEISVPAIADPGGLLAPVSADFTFGLGTPSANDIYTLNAGGSVNADYTFVASGVGDVVLSQLIYDCSGNSFHYNSDYVLDSVTIRIVPGPPEVTLIKSVSPSEPVDPGTSLAFTIAYSNIGSGTATNFVITDTLHPLLVDVEPLDGGTFEEATRTITWNIGTLGPGDSGEVHFISTVSDLADDVTIPNVATGDADQFDPITSETITIVVPPLLPRTGILAAMLALLGLAFIGVGRSLLLPDPRPLSEIEPG